MPIGKRAVKTDDLLIFSNPVHREFHYNVSSVAKRNKRIC